MARNEQLIEIIIPNWNGKRFLQDCLDSLRHQSSRNFSVTVVDNGSTDGSVALLETDYPEINLLRFPDNRGFSAAVNLGIERTTAPWILLLNNDMEIDRDCLSFLERGIEQYPDYDFFALKMRSFHQRDVLDGAGDGVLRGGVGYRLGTMEHDGRPYDTDKDVFGACAGAALYRRDMFSRVGLFDNDFFAYLEDVDLNMRARRAGLRCRFLATAVVYHIGSATSGSKINPLTIRLSTRNNLNVLVKNYPISLLIRFFPVIFLYQAAWLVFALKKKMGLPYLQGLVQFLGQMPQMLARRRIAGDGLISPRDFGELLSQGERDAVSSIMARRDSEGKNNLLLKIYWKLFL